MIVFLLTRLSQGVTTPPTQRGCAGRISTHTPLARRDIKGNFLRILYTQFLLTRLSQGVTAGRYSKPDTTEFLLTRLSQGVTLEKGTKTKHAVISTHTPLARRDCVYIITAGGNIISTHTPLARRDLRHCMLQNDNWISTHTPLARRDPPSLILNHLQGKFLLTRLSQGVTHPGTACGFPVSISTHTPLARRDQSDNLPSLSDTFLLTRLSQGVTNDVVHKDNAIWISTHTPLARRDAGVGNCHEEQLHFYSHASRKA